MRPVGVSGIPPVRTESIPWELKRRPQWVNWKLEERDGNLTKVPYTPCTGHKASSTDLMTWGTFEEAIAALRSGRYEGVGFMFCSADPFTGVDLDHCVNPETGEIAPWAREVIDRLGGYAELSPSGEGVHLIVKGRVPVGRKRGNTEGYSERRFFTMTGRVL